MSVLHELSVDSGLVIPELERIVTTAPKRYKVYRIPKKNGEWRQIAHPARELKVLQRLVLDKYLHKFPIHDAAMAYSRGKSIGHNASYHANSKIIMKLDFKQFFNSILVSDWKRYIARYGGANFSDQDVKTLSNILFWGEGSLQPKCLSIGAPTSPILSNILLYDLDVVLRAHAEELGVNYTRYADDVTVSGNSIDELLAFEKMMIIQLRKLKSPKLEFNDEKRGIFSTARKRMVTGIILTPEGGVSIGRDRKRMILALMHRFSLGQLEVEKLGLLKGMLGFSIAIEPMFLARLRSKYGDGVVDAALRIRVPKRHEVGQG